MRIGVSLSRTTWVYSVSSHWYSHIFSIRYWFWSLAESLIRPRAQTTNLTSLTCLSWRKSRHTSRNCMKRSLTSSHHLQMLVLFRDNRTDRSRKLIKLLILHNNLKILPISQRWLEVLPITRRGLNKSWTGWALIREVWPNQIMSNLPPLILKTQTQC